MSSIESIATPTLPTSPSRQRVVGVVAHLRRQIEGDAQAVDALREQVAVARVRLGGRAKPGVLPHRPQPAAIHRRLDAAREREFAGEAELGHWVSDRGLSSGVALWPSPHCSAGRMKPSPVVSQFQIVSAGAPSLFTASSRRAHNTAAAPSAIAQFRIGVWLIAEMGASLAAKAVIQTMTRDGVQMDTTTVAVSTVAVSA